jgi:hypothetical protein
MPAALKLQQFGREIYDAFGHRPYQVGSSLRALLDGEGTWRDVDVRLILPDEEFDAMFGRLTKPRMSNPRWSAYVLAFTARGRELTGLPIDFQIDRETEANEEFDGPRSALGILLDRPFMEEAA